MKRMRKQTLDGNVETLLLAILEPGPSYGYAIIKELSERAQKILQLGEGTIYPVLHRLEEKKFIAGSWRRSDKHRPRKYYRLTPKGRKALAENRIQWQMLAAVMEKVLGPAKAFLPKTQPRRAMI